jgi:hypothetical protein
MTNYTFHYMLLTLNFVDRCSNIFNNECMVGASLIELASVKLPEYLCVIQRTKGQPLLENNKMHKGDCNDARIGQSVLTYEFDQSSITIQNFQNGLSRTFNKYCCLTTVGKWIRHAVAIRPVGLIAVFYSKLLWKSFARLSTRARWRRS